MCSSYAASSDGETQSENNAMERFKSLARADSPRHRFARSGVGFFSSGFTDSDETEQTRKSRKTLERRWFVWIGACAD
jgi:hypothetical protein